MTKVPRTYPHGVSCWVDTEQTDPRAAMDFYGGLFDWTFTPVMPEGAPGQYYIAQLHGEDVAAIGSGTSDAAWNTYFAVTDADSAAAQVAAAGGRVESAPEDAGPGGRTATCRDPQGAEFRLWQPYRRLGAQVVNLPGSWNFSNLHVPDRDAALTFYTRVFGWNYVDLGSDVDAMISVPGYGDHLAATVDPDIYLRQANAPAGFADVIGAVERSPGAELAQWRVIFSVIDLDASAGLAQQLGATIVKTSETAWAALAVLRDPQGAELTLSEFRPPE